MKKWLFWDWWHIEHQDNAQILQGKPTWEPDGTYEDPAFDYLGMWPTVYYDEKSGKWRMYYAASGFPIAIMGAESEDGIKWEPMNCPEIAPGGEKIAPHHLFAIEASNGGPVYVDQSSEDGKPLKFFFIQRGGPVAKRALLDENSYFHELVKGEGVKSYLAEQGMAYSQDGINWSIDENYSWGKMPWHPDPPLCCFKQKDMHVMVTRPGWGDRRIAIQTSCDGKNWDGLHVILQPDLLDLPQTQFYGMPVTEYEGYYIGFLWMAHFSNSDKVNRFNQLWGSIDCQLAYSFDGLHFQRGIREPFIPLNEPGLPGSGVMFPTAFIDRGDELFIYSATTMDLHFQNTTSQFIRKGEIPPSYVTLHRLRKDGFMYLASKGHWASVITKPMVLNEPVLNVNAKLPYGNLLFQITDLESRPLEGFEFENFIPISSCDKLEASIEWKERKLDELIGKIIRIEFKFRNCRIFSVNGNFHFADALDVALILDGKTIDKNFMDF